MISNLKTIMNMKDVSTKPRIVTSIFLIIIILSYFYWFQIRPANIRRGCYREIYSALHKNVEIISPLELKYEYCLHKYGI